MVSSRVSESTLKYLETSLYAMDVSVIHVIVSIRQLIALHDVGHHAHYFFVLIVRIFAGYQRCTYFHVLLFRAQAYRIHYSVLFFLHLSVRV